MENALGAVRGNGENHMNGKTKIVTIGLLLAGVVLGVGSVPTAAADGPIACVYVVGQGWTCIPGDVDPDPNQGPIFCVYDVVTHSWHCYP